MPVVFCCRPVWRAVLLVLLPVASLGSLSLAAPTGDAFSVRNIVEDIHDENPTQARNRALVLAQRDAYLTLLQRVTASADWPRLPKLDDAAIEDLVQDVGIDREKVSASRALLTLSVSFKPDGIRRLLRDAGIAYAEWRGRPLLLLPLWQTESGAILGGATNPWRDLWQSGAVQGLVPVQVPKDQSLEGVTAAMVTAATPETLADLLQKLAATDLLVVLAAAGKAENGQVTLDLTLTGIGPLASQVSGQRGYGADAGETLEQLMMRAASDLSHGLDDSWKGANLLQYDKQGSLMVMVPLTGFEDWLRIREKLGRATAIRSYDLSALSRSEAALILHYVGEEGQLQGLLMQNGLVLTWDDAHWSLRTVSARAK